VSHRELEQLGDGAVTVLDRFVAARLVTADATGAQVSHEALLSAWPRLADWLDADRAGLRLHHQLTDGANAWRAAEKDPSLLQRGTRLALTSEWASEAGRSGELNDYERDFLDASQALQAAEASDARRRTRRTQQLLGLVAALALVASVLAGFALEARSAAKRAGNEALSRQVAIEASQLEPTDPALAMQLALAAYRISPTVQARAILLDASASEMPTRILGPSGPTFLAIGDDGHLLAVAQSATDRVDLYSLKAVRPVALATLRVASPPAQTFTVALSPDGQLLAASGTDGTVTLYDVSDPSRPAHLATLRGFTSTVYDVTFGPGGRTLAAASNDGSVRQWDLSQPARPSLSGVVRAPGNQPLQAVGYSTDGRLLAAAGAGGTLLIWRSGEDRGRTVSGAGTTQLTSLAFSPNGRILVTGGEDDVVRVFSVATSGDARPARSPLVGFSSWVNSVAFSPDGRSLVAGSSDDSLREWATSDWTTVAVLEHTSPVTGAAFLPAGNTLVTADADGTVRLWSMPPPSTYLTPGAVFAVDYTANGSMLAAASGGTAGDVSLWDVADPWRPVHVGEVTMPPSFGSVAGVGALGPSGQLLAVGNAAARIQLVSLANPRRPQLVGPPLSGAAPPLEELALSPAGTVLASGDNSGHAHLWDVSNPAHPRALATLSASGYLIDVAFSPNGKLFAAASNDDKVWLWDVSRPSHPKLLAVLGGFASYAYCVAFTPDGHTLIAGSADDTIRLWDLANPNHPSQLGGPLTGPTSYVYSLSVSPDGRTLAAAAVDHAVWLWDISDPAHPALLADLAAATGVVSDVTFSPNGHTLVASGSDQVLTFWDYHPSEVAARICSLTVSQITRAEWAEYVQGAAYSPPCR
jgi:WD40 repeat protein